MRTIPDEAWLHVGNAVFHNGALYPDTIQRNGTYIDSDDEVAIKYLSYFTLENYSEWASATVFCPRAPFLEECLFRFDDVDQFIENGYSNPYREPGCPDWYFFWIKNFSMHALKTFARNHNLIPQTDLHVGKGGYGIETGLRGKRDGFNPKPL